MPLKQAASEKRSLETVLNLREDNMRQANIIIARLSNVTRIELGATVVDIGAAHGLFLMACQKLGYNFVGIDRGLKRVRWHMISRVMKALY